MKLFGGKRILSLLVAVCMIATMLPAGVFGASAADVGTVYSYKFHEAVKATSGGASYDMKNSAFTTDYNASQNAGVGSAKWMLDSLTEGNTYSGSSADVYGIFGFGTKGGSGFIKYKIHVPENARYDATFRFYEYGSSTPVDVYLTPVGATAENFLMNIDKANVTSARSVTMENTTLLAGDYYLTIKQLGGAVAANRYFAHHSFELTVTGDYDPSEITAVLFDQPNLALDMDGMGVLTPYVLPETADDGSVTFSWTSSDENVVMVDDGTLFPIGPGFATVTATAENGKFGVANVLVCDQDNFEYNFTKGYRGTNSTAVEALVNMGYPQTMKGSPLEILFTDGVRYIETAPWAFERFLTETSSASITTSFPNGGATTTTDCRGYVISGKDGGGLSFRIAVPKNGTYSMAADITKGSGYGSGAFYLAPADAANPTDAQYAISDEISFQSATLADHTILDFGEKRLTAGEYILSVKGNITALFWRSFMLTNPNVLKEVQYLRDSLKVAVGQTASVEAVVIPSAAPDASITYTTDSDCVTVDATSGKVTGVKEGTAVITATANADESKYDTITIEVGGKNFYYDFMKSAGFGLVPSKGDDKFLVDTPFSQDFKYTTSGSADEVGVEYESNGWKIGSMANSSQWTWSESAIALGLYTAINAGGSASIHIDVPLAGNYDVVSVHSMWTKGTACDYYLAPVDAENPIAAQYKVNTASISHKSTNGTNYATEALVGEVSIPTAGEYILTFAGAASSQIFVRGIRLADADVTVAVESIALDKSGVIEMESGESVAVVTTVLPANATDPTVTLASSDERVAKVDGGVVTAIGTGIATITATANDGSGASDSFDVMCNMSHKYTYEFRDTMGSLYGVNGSNQNVHAPENAFGVSYAISESLGSAPWMFDGSNNPSGYEYFDYTSSSKSGFGVFGMNYNEVGLWNSIKIRVDEGAKYTGMLRVSDWSASNAFDIYIAPTFASDRVAEEYKVGSFAPSGLTNHGMQILLDTVAMPAGEYYVTFKVTAANGGLISLWDLELYDSGDLAEDSTKIELSTASGASLRSSGEQGLRFVSSVKKNADYGKIVEYGTVLIPTADLNGDTANLVLGYKNRVLQEVSGSVKVASANAAAKVEAKYLYLDSETERSFTAVLIGIAPEYYTREISARAYAIYEDASGVRRVVYGDSITTRSPYTVAQKGLADPNVSAADKKVFQAIVDAVNNL